MLIKASEVISTRRRVYFHLVDATDFNTPETGEAGGQPQISTSGGAWTNTGIGTLTAIGNGRYYADLTAGAVISSGTRIQVRYKSANTAEFCGPDITVVSFDPYENTVADDALTPAMLSPALRAVLGIIDYGTAQSATSNTIQLRSAFSAADDALNGAFVMISGGSSGNWERAIIIDYVSSTDTCTVEPWINTPTGTIEYVVFASPKASSSQPIPADLTHLNGDTAEIDVLELFLNVLDQTTGQIQADTLESQCITAAKIAPSALTTSKFGTSCFTSDLFASDCFGAAQFQNNTFEVAHFEAAILAAMGYITSGTAQAVSPTSITLAASFSANTNVLVGAVVHVHSSTNGKHSSRTITAWNNTTKEATIDGWDQQPTGTVLYTIRVAAPFHLTAANANKIADHVRRRTQASVEASSNGDALSMGSEYGFIQQAQESNTVDNPGFLTIYQTDGVTQLGQRELTTSPSANKITGIK